MSGGRHRSWVTIPPMASLVVVTGPPGGAGKSTVARALADRFERSVLSVRALTAPEADPVCGSYLPEHSLATLAGECMGGGVHLGDSFDANGEGDKEKMRKLATSMVIANSTNHGQWRHPLTRRGPACGVEPHPFRRGFRTLSLPGVAVRCLSGAWSCKHGR